MLGVIYFLIILTSQMGYKQFRCFVDGTELNADDIQIFQNNLKMKSVALGAYTLHLICVLPDWGFQCARLS